MLKKKSCEVAISEKNKLCENLKRVIDTKYKNFLEPVFSEYEMVWVQKQQEAGQITTFYEHFKEPLGHANFLLNFCLKKIQKFKNYVNINHKGKEAREIRLQSERNLIVKPNVAKIGKLMMCFSSSNDQYKELYLLTMVLMDQRLTTTHDTLNAILNIKINDKVFTESEKN